MLAVKKGADQSNMKLIKPEEMLMGAEAKTLALFVRYKLAGYTDQVTKKVAQAVCQSDCAEYVQKV